MVTYIVLGYGKIMHMLFKIILKLIKISIMGMEYVLVFIILIIIFNQINVNYFLVVIQVIYTI